MGFDKLLDVLKRVQARYPALSKRMEEASALARWEAAVGPAIAKHTRAVRIQDSVLWVEVDHPIWKSELHHRKRQILTILNQNAGPPGSNVPVTDIFFVDSRTGGRSKPAGS